MAIGYRRPVIHILNKQEFIYDEKLSGSPMPSKKNLIVMGDILEDVCMAKVSGHETILNVGFLNCMETQGYLLEDFKREFDLIILKDGSL